MESLMLYEMKRLMYVYVKIQFIEKWINERVSTKILMIISRVWDFR